MPISQVCLLLLVAIIAFPVPHLNNFFARALYYSCVFMLESCLFSQLNVELLSLLLFHFLLFCVPICCEKPSLGGD